MQRCQPGQGKGDSAELSHAEQVLSNVGTLVHCAKGLWGWQECEHSALTVTGVFQTHA